MCSRVQVVLQHVHVCLCMHTGAALCTRAAHGQGLQKSHRWWVTGLPRLKTARCWWSGGNAVHLCKKHQVIVSVELWGWKQCVDCLICPPVENAHCLASSSQRLTLQQCTAMMIIEFMIGSSRTGIIRMKRAASGVRGRGYMTLRFGFHPGWVSSQAFNK